VITPAISVLSAIEGLEVATPAFSRYVVWLTIAVLVALYSGLLPGRAFTELRLRNIALEAVRAEDGSWAIRGFPGQQKPGGLPFIFQAQALGRQAKMSRPAAGDQ